MPVLDPYGPFVLAVFAVTSIVLLGYLAYLRSRLGGLRRELERLQACADGSVSGPSEQPELEPVAPGRLATHDAPASRSQR